MYIQRLAGTSHIPEEGNAHEAGPHLSLCEMPRVSLGLVIESREEVPRDGGGILEGPSTGQCGFPHDLCLHAELPRFKLHGPPKVAVVFRTLGRSRFRMALGEEV